MTVTPQTNATLREIATALLGCGSVCVCGHANPDGDCVGSTLALAAALRARGVDAVALLADDAPLDPTLAFLPGAGELAFASGFSGGVDAFVAVDAPNEERLGEAACRVKDASPLTVTVDHHASPERMSDLSYTDPDAAATTMIVWRLARLLGLKPEEAALRDVAECAYAGLLTDTGRFMFQNTDADALALASEMVGAGIDPSRIAQRLFQDKTLASVRVDAAAVGHLRLLAQGRAAVSWISLDDMDAAGAEKADAENAVNVIRSVRGVEVACMLKERDDCVRGSLRSKGATDVSALARELGGGGHAGAAGFTLFCPLPEAVETMSGALERLVG